MVDEPGSKLSFFLSYALSLSLSLSLSLVCVLCRCRLPCVFLRVELCSARTAASNNHGITARPVPSTGCDKQEHVVGWECGRLLRRTGTRIKIKETQKETTSSFSYRLGDALRDVGGHGKRTQSGCCREGTAKSVSEWRHWKV